MATPISTIEVTQRPNKDLYKNNPAEIYDVPYYNSRWVSAHLPIVYKLSNDRFPVNTFDPIFDITGVANNNGNAELVLFQESGYEDFIAKNYIEVTGTTLYDGIYRILSVSAGRITINTAFQGDDIGFLQTYYNNYFIGVRVFAGKPDYHPLASQDPLELITENPIRITPDGTNISTVDVSGLIKDKISMDYDIDSDDLPNDTNAWTSLVIEFFESFDQSENGIDIETVTSTPETDGVSGCVENQDVITNGDFSSGLTGWTNEGSGTSWVDGGGFAQMTFTASGGGSKFLQQDFSPALGSGLVYTLTATLTNSNATNGVWVIKINRGLTSEVVIYTSAPPNADSPINIDLDFLPTTEIENIAFLFRHAGPSESVDVRIDDISMNNADCKPYIFAHNGIKQFQDSLGGNFGDYLGTANFQLVQANWLTSFQMPVIFDDYYFTLDTILPEDAFSNVVDREIYLRIEEYTEDDTLIQSTDVLIDDLSDGVYRNRLDNFARDAETCFMKVQVIAFPSNTFEDGDDGTFDATSAGNPDPSDWDVTRNSIGGTFSHQTSALGFLPRKGTGFVSFNVAGVTPNGVTDAYTFDTNVAVIPNATYELKAFYGNGGGDPGYYPNLRPLLLPEGYTKDSVDSESSEFFRDLGVADGVWTEMKTVFNTGANTALQFKIDIENDGGALSSGMSMMVDDITLIGPIFFLTEKKTIEISKQCIDPAFEPLNLRWLNTLGSWDSWLFTARKDHITNVADKSLIRRNVLRNWDTEFITGETEDDYIKVDAFRKLTVRSQYLTLQQIEAVKEILYAIRVQAVDKDLNKITVLVDSGSFNIRQDRQKLYTIEFDIQYTDPIRIQQQ